jgi:Predicted membrane protein
MALNNPAFNNPAFQDPKAVRTYPGGAQAANIGTAQRATTDLAAQAQLEGMYAAPPAGAIETDRMTVEDTIWKTAGLFAILVVTAVVGWVWTMAPVTAQNTSPSIVPWIVGGLGGFVLAMVVIFTSRKKVRPP